MASHRGKACLGLLVEDPSVRNLPSPDCHWGWGVGGCLFGALWHRQGLEDSAVTPQGLGQWGWVGRPASETLLCSAGSLEHACKWPSL